jgi:hypothetical protein
MPLGLEVAHADSPQFQREQATLVPVIGACGHVSPGGGGTSTQA